MKSRRVVPLIVAIVIQALTACNYSVGECWRRGERGEGSEGAGAGYGEGSGAGAGSGDFGDAPREENGDGSLQCNKTDGDPKKDRAEVVSNNSQDPCPVVADMAGDGASLLTCSDACRARCPPGMASVIYVDFDPSDFPFVTILADDGTDKGGGAQQAKASLKFEHKTIPGGTTEWYCDVTIKMPIRTEMMGRIGPLRAAELSEECAEAAARIMDYKLPQGIFCKMFADQMKSTFKLKYPRLGASVTSP